MTQRRIPFWIKDHFSNFFTPLIPFFFERIGTHSSAFDLIGAHWGALERIQLSITD